MKINKMLLKFCLKNRCSQAKYPPIIKHNNGSKKLNNLRAVSTVRLFPVTVVCPWYQYLRIIPESTP